MSNDVSVTVPKANPNMEAQGAFQFLNRPMLSQYMESEHSIFGTPYAGAMGTAPTGIAGAGMMMPGGMGMMGMGMMNPMMYGGWFNNVDKIVDNAKKWTNGMYDIYDNSSDRQTQFVFKQRGNQYSLNTGSSILNNLLKTMNHSIHNNDMRVACDTFDRIFDTIKKQVGTELLTHEERINAEESIRAAIIDYYEQVNGSSLREDIETYGDGVFENGFKKAISMGFYTQNDDEQTISYMTGNSIQDVEGKESLRNTGKIVGGAAPGAVVGAGVGAKIGGGKGAVIGAIIGGIISGITGIFVASDEKPDLERVHEF